MEHLKSYYTIERHLEETAKANKSFEILDAIWKLNKKNLSSALSNISQYFPHYSLHDRSHSNTIINNIESFLGEERIKKLSPTNAWLILMSSFTHDLGMIVFHDLIEKEWQSKDFQNYLSEIENTSTDDSLQKSAQIVNYLQNLSTKTDSQRRDNLEKTQPLEIRNAVTLLVSEYIRRIHHKRSSDIISGTDKAFFDIAKSFYADQIPDRLLNILGDVAYLHGVEFYEIFDRLDYQSNGISNDKINPRFISCLLRLGDLLDVDDNRFNVFTEKVFKFPKTSLNHKKKHSSIRHLLITPESIEITADCPDEEVFRMARSWFDWLEDEVEKQGKEWSNIAPSDLGGSSPTIPKGKIKVFYNDKITNDQLLNLRFQISNSKIFEIIEGSSLYEKAEFTFIRELVQNALDASKIQLWKEIEKGTFDFVFRTHFNNSSLSHNEIIDRIIFPTDIPHLLSKSFEVTLSIDWKDDSEKVLEVSVQDNGTGISDNSLIRMTKNVGESRNKDVAFLELLERMPFWLKPTGAFGIGLQSLFLVTDSFLVHTKSEGEESKEIRFNSAKKNKYSSITKTQPAIGRGTKVIVDIKAEDFPKVFGTSFSHEILSGYDFFTDKYQNVYIPKINHYINSTLSKVSHLKLTKFGEVDSISNMPDSSISKDFKSVREKHFYGNFYIDEHYLQFQFFENVIGSECIFYFPIIPDTNSIDINHRYRYSTKCYVRDIPVDTNLGNFYDLQYTALTWNLMSPKSDKILNISREKVIARNFRNLTNTLFEKILPISFELIQVLIKKNLDTLIENYSENLESLSFTYFETLLSYSLNLESNLNIEPESKLFLDYSIPTSLISYQDREPINYSDFFSQKNFVLPIIFHTSSDKKKQETKVELIDQFKEKINISDFIVWHDDYFLPYLRKNFSLSRVIFSEKGKILFVSEGTNNTININSDGFYIYLREFIMKNIRERNWNHSCLKYEENLSVIRNYPTGFERLPNYCNEFIISPFANENEFKKFKKPFLSSKTIKELENRITVETVKTYLSESLIELVVEKVPERFNNRTTQNVIDGYRRLIIDMIHKVK